MAPEQLQGHEADGRSDIWSFGCVVYQMLTGELAFAGESAATIISTIIRDTPKPIRTFAPGVPTSVEHVISRCLQKDADGRWQSVQDVAAELTWASTPEDQPAIRPSRLRRSSLWAVMASLVLGAIGGFLAVRAMARPADARPLWFDIRPVEGNTIGSGRGAVQIAVSPDGDKLAYSAVGTDGIRHLWVHRFSGRTPQQIAQTDRATYPFWAPDNRWIGFGANGKLMKVDTVSGTVQTIGDVPAFGGATWNADGVIVFSAGRPRRLCRLPSTGGAPTQLASASDLTELEEHNRPQFLSDGHHVIFQTSGPRRGVVRDGHQLRRRSEETSGC